MAAESNVNQISNIDLAEEVTEETPQPVQNHMPEIDEEKRKEMMEEITKLENEIVTIKQALQRKETQLAKLRQELGLTRWSKIQNSQAVSKSKQALSDAGAKTGQALRSFGTATANKWTEIKASERVQSMSEKFWATTGAVKAKLVGGEQKELKEPPPAEIAQSKESPSPI